MRSSSVQAIVVFIMLGPRRRGRGNEPFHGLRPVHEVDDLDAETNPAFAPVHTYHLGLWFGSPQEAEDAGCPGTVTAFDGDQEAGVQALSTRNFPALHGPLRQIQ
jgi:hypothetical protein